MKTRPTEVLRLLALVAVAAIAVGEARSTLFDAHKRVRERQDVYFLPPPDQLLTMSLGYRAALADALWAHVLVSQGLHTFERRRFENLTGLYDAILALDPNWRAPYLYADALFTFQSSTTPYEDLVRVREILERGARERPFDPEIWLNLGQFVSFVAPGSYLEPTHPEVAKQWRVDGAKMLARAAELGAGDKNFVAWQAIGGAGIYERAGEREAAIRFLERTRVVTDDPELREYIDAKLRGLLGEREMEERLRVDDLFRKRVTEDLPFVNRRTAVVLGPPVDPARCAGAGREHDPACATSWRQWTDRLEKSPR